jgi:hypothetical protein
METISWLTQKCGTADKNRNMKTNTQSQGIATGADNSRSSQLPCSTPLNEVTLFGVNYDGALSGREYACSNCGMEDPSDPWPDSEDGVLCQECWEDHCDAGWAEAVKPLIPLMHEDL